MSKSIYEKALDILRDSEQMNNIVKTISQAQKQEKLLGHYKDLAEVRKELYDLVEHTLQQAHNQEKLLELYRKLSAIRNDLLSYREVFDDYDDFEYIETQLENEIKELENDK